MIETKRNYQIEVINQLSINSLTFYSHLRSFWSKSETRTLTKFFSYNDNNSLPLHSRLTPYTKYEILQQKKCRYNYKKQSHPACKQIH